MTDEIIEKIENGPAILFLGQNYLSHESGTDIFLDKSLLKYGDTNHQYNTKGYDKLFNININKDYDSSLVWLNDLCKAISVPSWLKYISKITWSTIYTSAIDTVVDRAFTNEWRNVQTVSDEKFRVLDPRNRFNLHIVHLYGSIGQHELTKRAPFSITDKSKRKFSANALVQKIPEILTNKGILIIDCYDEYDWLSIEDLYSIISQVGKEQVLFFSVTENILNNVLIQDLITSNKLIIYKESFSEILSQLEIQNKITFNAPEPDDYYGKWISIDSKKIKIPQDLINLTAKTATIIDDSLFYNKPFRNDDEKYIAFKSFLSTLSANNHWAGYKNGFAFERDYYTSLKDNVLNKINLNKNREIPVILFGQTSSGKSVSLGMLAYELSQMHKIPVLFIEKRYQKIDEFSIDKFCNWSEEHEARCTVVIWDGMVDIDLYYNLLKKLNTRGRNIVLVGSTYNTVKINNNSKNFIECPIMLNQYERKRFLEYLNNVDTNLASIISQINEDNLLAMLYRYLPATKDAITKGLKSEFEYFSKLLRNLQNTNVEKNAEFYNLTPIQQAMLDAGLIKPSDALTMDEKITIDNDEINLSDLLIFTIMVPGQFALNVPYELLLRTIGFDILSSNFFQALNKINLITWSQDTLGNIFLGARTAIEARILTNYLGGRKSELEYIKLLLQEVKAYDYLSYGFESNPEIQFAVELLNNINPNLNDSYKEGLYEITEVLRKLRENGQVIHPRMVLKEASFIRELVKDKSITLPESNFDLLERAELIVRESLESLKDFRERSITNYLKVELASIIGSRAFEYSENNQNIEETKYCYEAVKHIYNNAFGSNPENYNLLDVLSWTTEKLIKENIFNDIEKIGVEAEMINYFEIADLEGVSEQNIEDFNRRKYKFYELVKNTSRTEEVLTYLQEIGSKIGFYLYAKSILGDSTSDTKLYIERCSNTAHYLQSKFNEIQDDGRCLFLLLKTLWISKSKTFFFQLEKQAVPFSREDWEYFYNIINKLLFIDKIYESTTILYLKAVTEFHLNYIGDSFETFRILDIESDLSTYGRKRIIKSYLSSTQDGLPRIYSGEVKRSVSLNSHNKTGDIYVAELRQSIKFNLNEFNKSEYQEGEHIPKFYIGFNFRGPFAVPIKF